MSLKGQGTVLPWLAALAKSPGGHSAAPWTAGGRRHAQWPFRAGHESHLLCEAPCQPAPGARRTPEARGHVHFTWYILSVKLQPSLR